MIELNEKLVDYFAMDFQVSLHDILCDNFSVRRTDCRFKIRNNRVKDLGVLYDEYYKTLSIHTRIGNKFLIANDLFCYPELCKALRKIKRYPYFYALINLKREMPKIEEEGFQAVKENIECLFELLKPYQERKTIMDNKANHSILLYGKKKVPFSYQGGEEYDFSNSSYAVITSCQSYYRIKLSDVYYLNKIPRLPEIATRYKHNEQLYVIDSKFLFQKLAKQSEYKSLSKVIKDRDGVSFDIIGGIMNTPILIFYIKKFCNAKGKRYYVDCFKNKLVSNLSNARDMAREYVGNDIVLDVFHQHYQ